MEQTPGAVRARGRELRGEREPCRSTYVAENGYIYALQSRISGNMNSVHTQGELLREGRAGSCGTGSPLSSSGARMEFASA